MNLKEKYKGKSFAEIAETISKKYKNRDVDPVQKRSFETEITALRDMQETYRLKESMKGSMQMAGGGMLSALDAGKGIAEAFAGALSAPIKAIGGNIDDNELYALTLNPMQSDIYNFQRQQQKGQYGTLPTFAAPLVSTAKKGTPEVTPEQLANNQMLDKMYQTDDTGIDMTSPTAGKTLDDSTMPSYMTPVNTGDTTIGEIPRVESRAVADREKMQVSNPNFVPPKQEYDEEFAKMEEAAKKMLSSVLENKQDLQSFANQQFGNELRRRQASQMTADTLPTSLEQGITKEIMDVSNPKFKNKPTRYEKQMARDYKRQVRKDERQERREAKSADTENEQKDYTITDNELTFLADQPIFQALQGIQEGLPQPQFDAPLISTAKEGTPESIPSIKAPKNSPEKPEKEPSKIGEFLKSPYGALAAGKGVEMLGKGAMLLGGYDRFSPNYNPYEQEALNLMRSQGIDTQAVENKILAQQEAAMAGTGNVRSTAVQQALQQGIYSNTADALANTELQQQQLRNQLSTQMAGALNVAGQQRVQAEDTARALTAASKASYQQNVVNLLETIGATGEEISNFKTGQISDALSLNIMAKMYDFGYDVECVMKNLSTGNINQCFKANDNKAETAVSRPDLTVKK